MTVTDHSPTVAVEAVSGVDLGRGDFPDSRFPMAAAPRLRAGGPDGRTVPSSEA